MKNDITGEVNGLLTAVSYVGSHPTSKRSIWLWQCECGNQITSTVSSVRYGNRQSCGCQRRRKLTARLSQQNRKAVSESCKNTLLYRYRKEAASRGYAFELEPHEFFVLTQQPCHYCGQPPANKQMVAWNEDVYVYTGIDRVDSSIGYVDTNVVSCCSICNTAKNNMSKEEFLKWVKAVYEYSVKHMLGSV